MAGPFALDGYDVLAPLDQAGRRWRATCLADGRPVVLRRWVGAADRYAEVRRQAALWNSVAGDGVLEVRDVVCDGADLVVVSAPGGDSLDGVLARRGALTCGQVVTLVVGLATTLACAHERGLAHGRLDASSVVLDESGRPRLTDYALGSAAEPSHDVAALVAMVSPSIDATTPAALAHALESSVDARGLAAAVVSTAPAEPLLSDLVLTAPLPAATRNSTGTRVRAAVVVAASVAILAAVIGVWWGRQEPAVGAPLPPRVSSAPVPTRPTPSLPVVVARLERLRVHALAHADAAELDNVEVSHTSLWRRDLRTVMALASSRLHLQKLRVDVRRIDVLSTSPQRAVARVVDAMSSYSVVDANGEVVERRPSRPPRRCTLVLVREQGRWKVRAVSRRSR